MDGIRSSLNRVFEAIGSDIRAYVDDGCVTVRDLIAFEREDGVVEVVEAADPDQPLFVMPKGDGLVAAMSLHVVRKVIANALS